MEYLGMCSWKTDYFLMLEYYTERAECEYLNRNFDAVSKFFNVIIENARSNQDKAEIYLIKMELTKE